MTRRARWRGMTAAAAMAAAWSVAFPVAAGGEGDARTPSARFDDLPGYDAYREVADAVRDVDGGTVHEVAWHEDGWVVDFLREATPYRLDLRDGLITEIAEDDRVKPEEENGPRPWLERPARGRQAAAAPSPDGRWVALHRDGDVHLRNEETQEEVQVTHAETRGIKFGSASWVYGEELDQRTAMWWSLGSDRLAFYEFDERPVEAFHLVTGWSGLKTGLVSERYPKAGDPNPIARLRVHDLTSGETVAVDVGPDTDQYVFDVRFSPDGRWLLFNRTNRHQNVLELMAADPVTGESRVVLTERQETWQANRPDVRFLDDAERFLWESEATGWKNLRLHSLQNDETIEVTRHEFPVGRILRVDEERGWVWYTAYGDENPLNAHLYRASLDGSGFSRRTELGWNHSRISIAPDGRHVIAVRETIDRAPETVVYDESGEAVITLAWSDTSAVDELGLPEPELFTCLAADGETTLYGVLHKPRGFDPSRTYPLVVQVYGGPMSQSVSNRYQPANARCEFGFLIAEVDNRGTRNRGKAFEGATYLKLGQVDLDDQVAAVRHLARRPYVDGERVGITGHSYGGYMAALAVMKHPDVFKAAVAASAVTDWRQYDTIYTERFMRTPAENEAGYDEGSCLNWVDRYRDGLLLLHGMVDDNVHPTNVFQLAHALQEAGKPFEMMLFPNAGHGVGGSFASGVTWGFLIERLGATPASVEAAEPETEDAIRP